MGTTTKLLLPYPEPTAPVANGADDIKALANRIEARMPRGIVNVASVTTAQGGFPTTPIAIATSLTFTAEAGRLYEIAASIPIAIGSGATVAVGALIASGGIGTLTNGALALPGNGVLGYLNLRWVGNMGAGARTITFTLQANAGTVTHNAAPTAPSTISVADLGPWPIT